MRGQIETISVNRTHYCLGHTGVVRAAVRPDRSPSRVMMEPFRKLGREIKEGSF